MSHVLVVEDDPMNATLFRTRLERRGGFRVTLTESPDEVLRLAASGDIDLIVMDVALTDSLWEGRSVSGVAICRMLKTGPATAAVPLIALTGADLPDERASALVAGCELHLAKPCSPAELIGALQRMLRPAAMGS